MEKTTIVEEVPSQEGQAGTVEITANKEENSYTGKDLQKKLDVRLIGKPVSGKPWKKLNNNTYR